MRNKLLKNNPENDKLNSKVGRTLTYKQLLKLEFSSKLPTKIKSLV